MNSKVANLEDWEKRHTPTSIFNLGRVYYYYNYVINSEFLLSAYYVLGSGKVYKCWFYKGYTHPMRKVILSRFTAEDKEA